MTVPTLSLLDTRVLGVLIEKERTVPDTYPLSLNALVSGCNQKSSREPVLNASEAEVQACVDHLKRMSLVMEGSGHRVTRFEHNFQRVLSLPSPSVALLCCLMLRGPQTPGELRINTERLYKFLDLSSVQGFLDELRDRATGALVVELPRRPGARENRWSHLLSGMPELEVRESQGLAVPTDDLSLSELAALKAKVVRLEDEIADLRALVVKICNDLGISSNG
jgi:uncharacterized protein